MVSTKYSPKEKLLRAVIWYLFLEIEAKLKKILRLSDLYPDTVLHEEFENSLKSVICDLISDPTKYEQTKFSFIKMLSKACENNSLLPSHVKKWTKVVYFTKKFL